MDRRTNRVVTCEVMVEPARQPGRQVDGVGSEIGVQEGSRAHLQMTIIKRVSVNVCEVRVPRDHGQAGRGQARWQVYLGCHMLEKKGTS